jgi:hypothetical protein
MSAELAECVSEPDPSLCVAWLPGKRVAQKFFCATELDNPWLDRRADEPT